jgi:hypothetical protein
MTLLKKYILLLALFFCSFAFATPIQDHKIDPTALAELTAALQIPPDANIVIETQKRWLRKPDQERWEIAELSSDQRQFVLDWASAQGLFSPWRPACKVYDQALILGATTSRMQMRLGFLKELWNEGVRFDQIVWLTGERPLDGRVDGLIDLCKNEAEAARLIWEEADLPEEMKRLPALFIAVPMKKDGLNAKRPNTEDTLIAWLQIAKEPCKALFVSDQPFCGYQFAVIKAKLPESFLFDVVGPGVDPTSHPRAAAITLDSLARWIYQEHIISMETLMFFQKL